MLVIINALKSISRSKGRNILIGIIVLAIAASSCVALAIRNAAREAEAAGLELVSITGTISVNRQMMMSSLQGGTFEGGIPDMGSMRETMSRYQDLSLAELLSYAQSEYVKDFYYSSSISLNAGGELEAYSTESSSNGSGNSQIPGSSGNNQFPGGMGSQGGMRPGSIIGSIAMGDFTVTGYSSEDAMTKFINGVAKITDGSMFNIGSSSMDCLISYELAVFNGLSVGDTIRLANPNAEDETYDLTIVGIYTDTSSSESSNMMRFSTSMDPANLIIVSYGTLQSIIDHSVAVAVTETSGEYGFESSTALNGQLSSTFVFSSRENYESFGEELYKKGLSDYYSLTSSDINNYEASLTPLKNLSTFAVMLLLIVLAVGALILVVINVFNIRERKYEVGVLTAIGIKKGKVALQFVTELLCVTLIAIVIGAGVGAAVSVPISNNLLSAQIEQMETQAVSQEQNFGRPGASGGMDFAQGGQRPSGMIDVFGSGAQADVTYLDKINATVNFQILGQLVGIGIILTLISSLAAVVFVMRYEPLKILANRT